LNIRHNLYFFHFVKEQYSQLVKTRNKRLRLFLDSNAQESGGGERDRTDDLLLAKQALSQLSYTPSGKEIGGSGWVRTIDPRLIKTVL
jgi:hypothetical protein